MHLRPADFVDNNRRETEEWRRQFRNAALLTLPVFISEPRSLADIIVGVCFPESSGPQRPLPQAAHRQRESNGRCRRRAAVSLCPRLLPCPA